jgi:microcin C transport system substrate-binding protein
VDGKKFRTGELVKGEFRHKLPAGFQSVRRQHTRNPKLQDVAGCARRWAWRSTTSG